VKNSVIGWQWPLALLTLAWSTQAAAITSAPSIAQMFTNFSDATVSLMTLVLATAFILGIALSGVAVLKFKAHAENPQQVRLQVPIFLTLIGACLVALPGSIDTATETMALGANTGTELLSRVQDPEGMPGLGAALTGILLFVKLIGHLAFFRGFLILKKAAEGQQGGEIGRALTHIFGGAAAININATISILANTFAPGMPLPLGLGG